MSSRDSAYLTRQLITYLGNKRALLHQIDAIVDQVKRRLGKDRLRILDAFAGSGVVSRLFKAHADVLHSNDFEDFAAVIGRCFLHNRSDVDWDAVTEWVRSMNDRVADPSFAPGFIEALYAPKDENNITAEDRVFYTPDNARRLDRYRMMIDEAPGALRDLLLGPLLAKASVHANTAGVFKGFYKDRRTKIGRYGGTNQDALRRITGAIVMEPPILSPFECDWVMWQDDANQIVRRVRDLDLAYFDPPYNQHPYGSNYFMLNLIVHYRRPRHISRVSGIPADWRRSGYNVRARSLELMTDLVTHTDAPFLLISFNDEGFIAPEQMHALLAQIGKVDTFALRYNTFRGSRNLRKRNIHVKEHLFLVERH